MATPQVLTTWKEIAAYMGKGVRTVQRWEEELGLPVHRPSQDRHIVLAFPEELDNWARRKPAVDAPRIKLKLEGFETRRRELERMKTLMRDLLRQTVVTRDNAAAIAARCKANIELRNARLNELRMPALNDSAIELAPAPTSDSLELRRTGTD